MLPNVFMKVKWMLEKVIHKDSTRYIVESLQTGTNKRKTADVYTAATPEVKSSGITPSGAETETNLVETLQWLLQYDQEQ